MNKPFYVALLTILFAFAGCTSNKRYEMFKSPCACNFDKEIRVFIKNHNKGVKYE
ncbi:hypothetical protein [Helicobacter cetorum]|uniref:hypothetical protein n=1 Tax=Helicobacter cetorum TaxID=138563 RepID=UPI000313E421|nr:hypothetical protein [Helicobacter cetorum]